MTLELDRPLAAMPPTAGASDGELVARARRGDRDAGDEIARRCRRPAYLLALQLLRDPDDALDVAQDALLRLFSTLDRIEPGRPVRPWLFAIVRNRARDLMRRRKVRKSTPLAGDDPEGGVELVDLSPGPDAKAERAELQARIWRALGALSEPQREILVLRDYQDLKYEEIAAVLRVPIGTVMSRLHRARQTLRERLTDSGGPYDA
jgi:RNA polymerase sigma-70 factor, ECF subfamily